MKKTLLTTLPALLLACILAACGGGGGGDDSSEPSPSGYWKMDSHRYVSGGNSTATTDPTTGITAAVVSTATSSGGDGSNGAYSGSALTLAFKGAPTDGVYSIVSDLNAVVTSDATTAPIAVGITVGIDSTTGYSRYDALSGKIRVTRDARGAYHFYSVDSVPATKTADVLRGVAGAPGSMTLTIVNAY